MRRIRTNLAWAFSYNTIGIPWLLGIMLPFTGFLLASCFRRSSDGAIFSQCSIQFANPALVESNQVVISSHANPLKPPI